MTQLGDRIRVARVRRQWRQEDLAEKAGLSLRTITDIESGRPGTAMANYFMVLWAMGLDADLKRIADPDQDEHGKILENGRMPQRVSQPRKRGLDF